MKQKGKYAPSFRWPPPLYTLADTAEFRARSVSANVACLLVLDTVPRQFGAYRKSLTDAGCV